MSSTTSNKIVAAAVVAGSSVSEIQAIRVAQKLGVRHNEVISPETHTKVQSLDVDPMAAVEINKRSNQEETKDRRKTKFPQKRRHLKQKEILERSKKQEKYEKLQEKVNKVITDLSPNKIFYHAQNKLELKIGHQHTDAGTKVKSMAKVASDIVTKKLRVAEELFALSKTNATCDDAKTNATCDDAKTNATCDDAKTNATEIDLAISTLQGALLIVDIIMGPIMETSAEVKHYKFDDESSHQESAEIQSAFDRYDTYVKGKVSTLETMPTKDLETLKKKIEEEQKKEQEARHDERKTKRAKRKNQNHINNDRMMAQLKQQNAAKPETSDDDSDASRSTQSSQVTGKQKQNKTMC